MKTDLMTRLALMTDAEARLCLSGVLEAQATARGPEYRKFVRTVPALKTALQQASEKSGRPELASAKIANQPEAIRALLVEMTGRRNTKAALITWLDGARAALPDPITTSLVLAGIVFVLSLDIDLELDDGKLHVHVKKAPTDKTILEKFFGIFG
jgi:hypothetical protein